MADQAEALQKQYSELSASVDKAVSEVNTAMVGLEEYVPTMQEKLAEAKDRIKTALKSVEESSASFSEISVLMDSTQQTVKTKVFEENTMLQKLTVE